MVAAVVVWVSAVIEKKKSSDEIGNTCEILYNSVNLELTHFYPQIENLRYGKKTLISRARRFFVNRKNPLISRKRRIFVIPLRHYPSVYSCDTSDSDLVMTTVTNLAISYNN